MKITIETDQLIFGLTQAFKAREGLSEYSQEYATLTQNILWLERALTSRGVDTTAILLPLAGIENRPTAD